MCVRVSVYVCVYLYTHVLVCLSVWCVCVWCVCLFTCAHVCLCVWCVRMVCMCVHVSMLVCVCMCGMYVCMCVCACICVCVCVHVCVCVRVAAPRNIWDLSYLTRNQTRASCVGSTESSPLNDQESACVLILYSATLLNSFIDSNRVCVCVCVCLCNL